MDRVHRALSFLELQIRTSINSKVLSQLLQQLAWKNQNIFSAALVAVLIWKYRNRALYL